MLDSRILDTLASTTLEADEDEHEHTDSCRRQQLILEYRKPRRYRKHRMTYEEVMVRVGWSE